MKLYELNISQTVEKLKSKEISAHELTDALIRRINEKEPVLHALNTICAESALKMAQEADERRMKGCPKSAFDGIPAIVKDNICTKGVKTTCSSKMLENFIPPYNAHVIDRFNAHGIITLAKSNLDEFAMGSSTEYSAFGPSVNPWKLGCVPGGSSGGSAVAVSSGMAPLALGTDTGGSIRQPCSYCGVVGLKPTYGNVSRYGAVAFASSLDQIGPITRSVEDAACVLNVICGYDGRDSTSIDMQYPDYTKGIKDGVKGMRVGLPKEYFKQGLDPQVKEAVENCVKLLEDMGAHVEQTSLPTFDHALSAYYIISSAEATSNLSRYDGVKYGYRAAKFDDIVDMYIKTRNEGFGNEVKRRIMLGNYVLSSGYYDAYYLKALKVRTMIKDDLDALFKKFDIILSPTTPTPAFCIGEKSDPISLYMTDIYTVPVNIAGMTAVSLPYGLSAKGLPIGVQIIAKPLDEATMLRAAWALEQALPPIGSPAFSGGAS